ncbi:NTP transferase domain-containing protein [Salmonella enterica subsp. diarizonae]|nr:NTP transferase domain-containing protein [Salmonella enterica subsp. diarizonae]EGV2902118.1 NTP transferase domain-containing protein [Salmonella enterica]EIE7937865.1 NTP transferase domain-containing protein [Salmonella enterica]
MKQVDCIITAAGLSSRMGQWKMMLPWHGATILDASIKNALQFCSRIILVSGFRAEELHERYSRHPQITLVYNPNYQQGLFTSVCAGASQVRSEYCFISLGDVPCLPAALFQTLWQQRGDSALLPQYRGVPGHPILITSKQLRRLITAELPNAMRKQLLNSSHRCLELDFPQMILDIDTPADFIRLQNYYE